MSAIIAKLEADFAAPLAAIVPNARRLSVSQIIRRLFRMAILLTAARLLGVQTFGTYALLLTIAELVSMISGYGYVDFLTREVARRPDAAWPLGKRITLLRLAYIVPSVGLALLVLALLGFGYSLILDAALLSLTLVPRAAGESAQGLLKGFQRFTPLPWIEFAQGATVLGSAPFLIFRGYGLRGIITAEVLGAAVGAIIAVRSVTGRLSVPGSDAGDLRELLRRTFVFNIYPLITNIYDRVDVVLLSKLAGSLATGIYALPYRIFATLSIIPYSLMGALLPVLSSSPIQAGQSEAGANGTCARAMKFLYLAALLIILLTLTLARPIILFVLGQIYADSIITIMILVWAAVPSFLNFALNTLLLSAHKEKAFLVTATVSTVFNITANLLLIPRYSFIAAAAVTVATECLLLAQNFYLVRKFMGRVVLPIDGLMITVVFAVMLAGFWGLQRIIPQTWAGGLACFMFAVFALGMVTGLRFHRAGLQVGSK